jgi:IS30 family transposase
MVIQHDYAKHDPLKTMAKTQDTNPEALKYAVDLINQRLRKSLDSRTPYEVLYSQSAAPVTLQI